MTDIPFEMGTELRQQIRDINVPLNIACCFVFSGSLTTSADPQSLDLWLLDCWNENLIFVFATPAFYVKNQIQIK